MEYGNKFESTIKMWEVLTVDSWDKNSHLSYGLISRGDGFEDSPDAEFISGGKHTKGPGGMAIGRHANFFHWGFVGSPKYMTEQAKLVFLNIIHYMKKFKGKKMLSPKVHRAIWTQESRKRMLTINIKDDCEYYIGLYKDNEPGKPTMAELLKRRYPLLFEKYGMDTEKYSEFYRNNWEYLYATPADYMSPVIDKEAQKLGIPAGRSGFIKTCLKELKRGDANLALILLKRYTKESLHSYKEWRQWYKKNKKRLFFSKMGGYKYYINIYNE